MTLEDVQSWILNIFGVMKNEDDEMWPIETRVWLRDDNEQSAHEGNGIVKLGKRSVLCRIMANDIDSYRYWLDENQLSSMTLNYLDEYVVIVRNDVNFLRR